MQNQGILTKSKDFIQEFTLENIYQSGIVLRIRASSAAIIFQEDIAELVAQKGVYLSISIQFLQTAAQIPIRLVGNQFLILLEIIGHGGYDFLVDRKELCILQCPMLEEVDPCHMVLDQEDAVVVPVVGTAILFQDAETFLEIRNFRIFRTCRNVRNTGTVRTHLCLANICDTCQAQYDYHDYLFQNFNNFRLLFPIIFK